MTVKGLGAVWACGTQSVYVCLCVWLGWCSAGLKAGILSHLWLPCLSAMGKVEDEMRSDCMGSHQLCYKVRAESSTKMTHFHSDGAESSWTRGGRYGNKWERVKVEKNYRHGQTRNGWNTRIAVFLDAECHYSKTMGQIEWWKHIFSVFGNSRYQKLWYLTARTLTELNYN